MKKLKKIGSIIVFIFLMLLSLIYGLDSMIGSESNLKYDGYNFPYSK